MSIAELYDVSILFPTADAARSAFATVFSTDESSTVLAGSNLTGIAAVSDEPMPDDEELDRRFVGPDAYLGSAYVGIKLGMMDQFSLVVMRTAPDGRVHMPDPWAPDGRMRDASRLVMQLLGLGGIAVVLHKAAQCVKSAAQFAYEVGDPDDPELRPFLAWIDVIAIEGTPGECRSYGMPHYFGRPNVRAVVPGVDQFSIERAMQALKFACGRMAAANLSAAQLPEVSVPVWYLPGRIAPELPDEEGGETIRWTGKVVDDGLTLELRCRDLPEGHPRHLWESDDPVGFDLYTKAVSDLLLRRVAAQGMTQVDAVRFEPHEDRPPLRILVYDNREMSFYLTAGFGRVASQSGTLDLATKHAELCLYCLGHDRRLQSVLINIGLLALSTPVQGGLKDWDGLPPDESGFGFAVVPLNDIPLGTEERPLGLRMLVPLTGAEYQEFRDVEDREGWYRTNIADLDDAASRWRTFLTSLG